MSTLSVTTLQGLASSPTPTKVEVASGHHLYAPGHVIQVLQTTKTDKVSTTSATAVDVTGLSLNITPQATSSKILVSCSLNWGGSNNVYGGVLLKRDSTTLSPSTAATGNQITTTFGIGGDNENFQYKTHMATYQFLDTPNTTSSTTYKVQVLSSYNSETFTINAPNNDADDVYIVKGTSTITVMEIAQ